MRFPCNSKYSMKKYVYSLKISLFFWKKGNSFSSCQNEKTQNLNSFPNKGVMICIERGKNLQFSTAALERNSLQSHRGGASAEQTFFSRLFSRVSRLLGSEKFEAFFSRCCLVYFLMENSENFEAFFEA